MHNSFTTISIPPSRERRFYPKTASLIFPSITSLQPSFHAFIFALCTIPVVLILKLSCSFFHYSPCILYCTTTSLYIDCYNNLYAGSPSYLLILFSALSAFAVGGLSIERNQKPLAPEITLAITHHNRKKQIEVKRSSRVNPHEIRIFSGCPYAVVK